MPERYPPDDPREWLSRAYSNLIMAKVRAEGVYLEDLCFLIQQAAEKAIKAVHYARGARAVIGHSVRALIEAVELPAPDLDDLLDAARELDLLYVTTRYPSGLDSGTPAQAFSATQSRRALERAAAILDASERALG